MTTTHRAAAKLRPGDVTVAYGRVLVVEYLPRCAGADRVRVHYASNAVITCQALHQLAVWQESHEPDVTSLSA